MLAFIHVAKTGGQSVETMLANTFGASYSTAPEWEASSEDLPESGFVVQKYQAKELKRLLRFCPWTRCVGGHPVTLWSGFGEVTPTKWFAIVRDPLARGASHYQYNLNNVTHSPLEWEKWVKWPVHHNHQVKMFSPHGLAEDAIERIEKNDVFVGLTEKFDESLVMLKKLHYPGLNIAYRRTNTATDNSLAKEVMADPEKLEQLKEMYAEDLIFMEYILEEHYPDWVKKYGEGLHTDVASFRATRDSSFNRWKYWQSRLNHHLILRLSHHL